MDRKGLALFPIVLAAQMAGSRIIDWGQTLLDLGMGSRTYKHIHHRSQAKLRRIARQRGDK